MTEETVTAVEVIPADGPAQTAALAKVEATAMVARNAIDVQELVKHRDLIRAAMEQAMVEGVHYGVIPGVQKPSLLKPGAETLLVLFRLAPTYHAEKHYDGTHLTVTTMCRLNHAPTGMFLGEGEGLCTTRESRYAYRQGGRVCPECGADAIIKGKAEYGGGWVCFKRKGGCGAKFDDGTHAAREFESAVLGRVENPDLPDMWNTVLKISAKRALIAAILNVTGASDLFTQDVEDMPREQAAAAAPPEEKAFDPAADLRESAPRGRTVIADGLAICQQIDPTVEWAKLFAAAAEAVYGQPAQTLEGEERLEFYRRFANAVDEIRQSADLNTIPPISESEITRAVAWAFHGNVIDVTFKQPDPPTDEPTDDPEPSPEQQPAAEAEEAEVEALRAEFDAGEENLPNPEPLDGEEPLPGL